MTLLSADALFTTIVKTRDFQDRDRDRSPQSYLSKFTEL